MIPASRGRRYFFPPRLAKSSAGIDGLLAPPVVPDTFRRALKMASREYLRGPVSELFPYLLRHACATHNYEAGMPLWDVQVLLGHVWASTTGTGGNGTRSTSEVRQPSLSSWASTTSAGTS
ncbi:tyrosine-type recombinase/integrase [Streptomyces sp. NPDC052012]|uniref:tyrosine-type recombinase/integrase n=1 Tax=Streptomyces sp. NPDC052012 TaxID=3155051 RepID=UPI00344F0F3B